VQLGEALFGGDLAHGPFDAGLHVEYHVLGGTAQVQEAPVEPLVQAGVLVDGEPGLGAGHDLDVFGDDLQSAELDLGVVHDLAGDLHGGLRGDALEGRLDQVALAPAPVGDLDGTGVVADQHELDVPLEAERADPSVDGDRLVQAGVEVGHEGARHSGNSLVAGALVAPERRTVDSRPGGAPP
jgi:hypothetical protein